MSESTEALIRLFKQQNIILALGIIIIASLGWLYVFHVTSISSNGVQDNLMNVMSPEKQLWNFRDGMSAFIMWSVMMAAMMLPSAMPMILVFATVNRRRHSLVKEVVPTWMFVSGYILMWIFFSLIVALIQLTLHNFSLISVDMSIINPFLGGIILVFAGIYQFTPVKEVCLKNCQSPLGFIMENWRDGKFGAFIMGLHHGLYCIGCCWILMILLFVAGVMNLSWVAIIALFIFLEKVLITKRWLSKIAGVLLVIWGIGLMGKNFLIR